MEQLEEKPKYRQDATLTEQLLQYSNAIVRFIDNVQAAFNKSLMSLNMTTAMLNRQIISKSFGSCRARCDRALL